MGSNPDDRALGGGGAVPARVTMRFGDRQGRRLRQLGTTTREIAADGMVRVVKKLKPQQMKRLRRARGGFVAEVTIPEAHGSCASHSSRPLTVRRLIESQHVWFQRDSIRRDLPPNTR